MQTQLAKIALSLMLALPLCGCAPIASIFPLYNSADTAFDAQLVGTWRPVEKGSDGPDKNTRWIFSHPGSGNFYDFRGTPLDQKGGFVAKARLVRLGQALFVDFEGDDRAVDQAEENDSVVPFPIVPVHMMGRVWLEGDTLRVHFLSDDWVKKQAKAGTLALAHLDVDGGQLLTATTADLRKFMEAHADDADALAEHYDFTRVKQ